MTAAHPLPVPGDDLDVAPLDLDDFTPEERAEIEESLAAVAAGRARLVPRDDIARALDTMRARGE